jgi:alanine dehydrogenase
MLVLNRAETEALLEPDALRRAVATAMTELSAGRVSMPRRIAATVLEHDGLLAAMPAYVPGLAGLATKLVSLFPRNAGSHLPTHQAVVVVFDPATGQPAAMLDGTSITAARTAAGSALSVELLARRDSRGWRSWAPECRHARTRTRCRAS